MIKASLYEFMTDDAGVSALIADRVYPMLIPPEAWSGSSVKPCAVYQRIGVERDVTLCGTTTLARSTFQIDAYATSYETADTVARAIKTALIDTHGDMAGTYVHACRLDTEFDLLDPEPGLFRTSMTFSIWHDGE